MIENGYAWVYTKYLKYASIPIRNKYLHAEFLAKENALGLWKMNDYIAPWEWRKHSRKRRREIKNKYVIFEIGLVSHGREAQKTRYGAY